MNNSVLAKMAVVISANSAEFNRALADTNKRLSVFETGVARAGKMIGAYFGVSTIYSGLEYGIGVLANFEKGMDTVAAITGATGQDFKDLEKNALDLGRATEYTAAQVAGLQTEYGRLGFSTQEILNSTKATINLATATGENLARSSEIAGSTLRAFGLDASEMTRVTDVMSSSFNKSALALDSFADSIKYIAPVAKAVDVTLEETTAMLGVLADAGIKGSQAGTSLRRIFTMLTADGRPLVERLDELAKKGISLADANDEVGLYAQTALLVLGRENDKVKELTASLNSANGETQRMADIMRDNLIGDWDKFTSAIEGAILQGQTITPVLREIVQAMTDIVNNPLAAFKAVAGSPFAGLALYADLLNALDGAAKDTIPTLKRHEEAYRKTWDAYNKYRNDFGPKLPPMSEARVQRSGNDSAGVNPANVDLRLASNELEYKQEKEFRELLKGLNETTTEDYRKYYDGLYDMQQTSREQSLELEKEAAEERQRVVKEALAANQKIAQSYMRVGDIIADALVSGMESGESFVSSLVKQTDRIVQEMYRQAIGFILAKAAKDSLYNPIGAIALATGAMIGMRALFATIQKGQSAGGGGGGMTSPRSADVAGGGQTQQFVLRGNDLVTSVQRTNYTNSRTGGVTIGA